MRRRINSPKASPATPGQRRPRTQRGELMDQSITYSLREICERCGVHAEYVIELVQFGIVEPAAGEVPVAWRFDSGTLLRTRKVLRMQQDLSLNLPGVAMSLDLLDEVEELRRQVHDLQLRLARFRYED